MKLNTRFLLAIPCLAAFIAVTGTAHANTINGSIWENATDVNHDLSATPPAGTPSATFTLSNSGSNIFNLSSPPGPYTINGFLASGGDTVNYLTEAAGVNPSTDTLNDTVFEFYGFTDLASGTYTINHDDGMILYVNGVKVIDSGAPTSSIPSSFTVSSDTGLVPFELLYAEVNGAPAVLSGPLGNLSQTPEPSSIILLGSGLLGVAGLVRRRMGV